MKAEKGNAPAGATAEASIDKQIQTTKGNVQMDNSSIIQNRVDTVQFHGAALYVININNTPYVAVKPVCEAIGVDAEAQRTRIMRHPVLNSVTFVTKATGSDGKSYDMLVLPLEKLNGFLFGINANRIKDAQIKAKLIEYQSECFDVLADYWQKGYAINPRPFKQGRDDVLTVEEADELRNLMKGWAVKLSPDTRVQGQFLQQGWSKLKAHFKAPYRQIPRFELPEALSIIMRHVNEWEAKVKTVQAHSVSDLILQGMDSLRAFVSVDLRTGERQVVALKDTERIVDLGSEDRVRALVHDLNHSYYPTILKTIQQHYIEVEQAYYRHQRRANDMPVCAQPI